MKTSRFVKIALLAGTAVLLNGCGNDNEPAAASETTAAADQQISINTSDTALPIALDNTPDSDQDLSDSALPLPI